MLTLCSNTQVNTPRSSQAANEGSRNGISRKATSQAWATSRTGNSHSKPGPVSSCNKRAGIKQVGSFIKETRGPPIQTNRYRQDGSIVNNEELNLKGDGIQELGNCDCMGDWHVWTNQ
jgi:hypothetical protein